MSSLKFPVAVIFATFLVTTFSLFAHVKEQPAPSIFKEQTKN